MANNPTVAPVLGWHFITDKSTTGSGNLTVYPGQVMTIPDTESLRICRVGLHSSERLTDALKYAPGHVLCRVGSWGDIQTQDDKLVARNRREWWHVDHMVMRTVFRDMALNVLRAAIQWQAERNYADPFAVDAVNCIVTYRSGAMDDLSFKFNARNLVNAIAAHIRELDKVDDLIYRGHHPLLTVAQYALDCFRFDDCHYNAHYLIINAREIAPPYIRIDYFENLLVKLVLAAPHIEPDDNRENLL